MNSFREHQHNIRFHYRCFNRILLNRIIAASTCAALSISGWVYGQGQLQAGYLSISANPATVAPVGTALFTFTNPTGVLVSEAGVAATEPMRSGRIFVDEVGTRTGIAIVNPTGESASVSWTLRDASGRQADQQNRLLGPGQYLARFVDELFPNRAAGFTGSLTFESDQPLAAITLRQSPNAQGEPLYTTLPVVDLSQASSNPTLVFPHIAAGEGYLTQLVLINSTSQRARGQVRLVDSEGQPLLLRLAGNGVTELIYQIEPHGVYRAELDRISGLSVGYAVLRPEAASPTPWGSAIFQYKVNGQLVTEAGVGAISPTTAARIFVDHVGTRTGLAVVNPGNTAAELTLTLLDRDGFPEANAKRTLAAGGHLARFADELFSGLADGFTGLLEVRSSSPIVPITLKLTINSRGHLVLTTLPVADLAQRPRATSIVFPQIAIGEGFTTRLILLNADPSSAVSGRMNFHRSDGTAMTVPLAGETGAEFSYQIAPGGGRQLFPGNTARLAVVSVIDPFTRQPAKEVVVNEGNAVRSQLRMVDSTGRFRDDFDAAYTSTNPDVATVDGFGNIQGKKAGFSTLTIAAGGVVTTATITVVQIASGVAGFETTGIAQDLARRLYLAATEDHTILLAQDLKQTPAVYAGTRRTPGFKNDVRLQSQFRNPAFLSFNHAEGSLYVSDGANHVIRRVQPGPQGKVETLAGTGQTGSDDGPLQSARFNNPQGIALDNRGNLWVADSGNHTIRRINLVTGTVETVAGKAGSPGLADGRGDAARFRSPAGIAVETESLAQQLERERRGDAPPPTRVIVADAGNGMIRRVSENGAVETFRSVVPAQASVSSSEGQPSKIEPRLAGIPLSFNSPSGVAVDPFGNIYVTETNSGRVKTILQNGDIVDAVQANTFVSPKGIAITQTGKVVIAESNRSAQEISYGEPAISSVGPDKILNKGGARITITGSNFSPDTLVVVAGLVIAAQVQDTQTILFTAPALPSGRTTLTVQNRGGLAQTSLLIDGVPLSQLPAGQITTVAGGTTFIGDGAVATSALIASPREVAVDPAGNLFIVDRDNHRIRRISAQTGIITTVAGTGTGGFSGDGGPATAARLHGPNGIAVDSAGNLYIADSGNQRIRKVDGKSGIITTIAGNGEIGFSGDGGPARSAAFGYSPQGVAVDASGNLFIADSFNHRIRKVDARTQIITTAAGAGREGFSGDGGSATAAALKLPLGIAIDRAGNLFIADAGNDRIRKVDIAGTITTVAGNGEHRFSGDNVQATTTGLANPYGVAVDAGGNLFIADSSNDRIRKVDAGTLIMTTVAGGGRPADQLGDNGSAAGAALAEPYGIVVDAAGNLFVADGRHYRVRKVTATTGVITTVAGIGFWDAAVLGDNRAATAAILAAGGGIAIDGAGNLLIADTDNYRVRRVSAATGLITTVAGNGTYGGSGDQGPATAAALNEPYGIALDGAGNLYIADTGGNHRIRKVTSATGIITTVAGGGSSLGDNSLATSAALNSPRGIAVDRDGNLFIADTGNHRIRRVDAQTRIITTVAGIGREGFSGDNGPATAAALSLPYAVAVDASGNLLIADSGNGRIRKVAAGSRIITSIAGGGCCVSDGEPASAAGLSDPRAIALDASGNIFIAVRGQSRLRKINASTGIITTVAGNGSYGSAGDNGPAAAAELKGPSGVALDTAGNIFIADGDRIRAVRGPIP